MRSFYDRSERSNPNFGDDAPNVSSAIGSAIGSGINTAVQGAGTAVAPSGSTSTPSVPDSDPSNLATLGDVARLIANYDEWIRQLRIRYTTLWAKWNDDGPDACQAYSNDLANLEQRWQAAHDYAEDVNTDDMYTAITPAIWIGAKVLFAKLTGGTFDDAVPAQQKYLAYVWAIRQGGEGAPVQTGDYSDLVQRIYAAETELGLPHPKDPTVQQPTYQISSQFLKSTNVVPTPSDMGGWLRLIAIGVIAGLAVQTISSAIVLKRELHEK